MRKLTFVFMFLFVAFISTSTLVAELPCFVHQVTRFNEAGVVPVTGFPTGKMGCSESFNGATGVVEVKLEYRLQYRRPLGPNGPNDYTTVQWAEAKYPLTGRIDRRQMTRFAIEGKLEGEYRVVVSSGGQYLETINFAVGRVPEGADTEVPYVIPSGTHLNGKFRFRAHLGGQVASGYMYQDNPITGAVVWVPAVFIETAPAGNLMLDLAEVQASDDGGVFDLSRPVDMSVTRDGGGAASCDRIFNPANPLRLIDVYSAPASR